MAGSTYGTSFSITTWGESHGPAIGAVIDGCPSGLPLSEEDIQEFLDRRKPGQSKYTTAVNLTRRRFSPAYLTDRPPARLFPSSFTIKTSVPEIMAKSRTATVPDMRIIHLTPSTAFVTTEGAADPPAERRLAGLPPEP